MKRAKTIKDHIKYYQTYGGIKPRRKTAPEFKTDPPAAPKPDPQLEAQARKIQTLEARVKKLANQPAPPRVAPIATKPDQSAKRLRALEARLQVLESGKGPNNGATAEAGKARSA